LRLLFARQAKGKRKLVLWRFNVNYEPGSQFPASNHAEVGEVACRSILDRGIGVESSCGR
jgi:hypothetical protein